MASFFAEDEDSDVERKEKQRRILQSIRDAPITDELQKSTEEQDATPRPDHFSEHDELLMLRENTRYRKYAAGRKRQVSPASPNSAKRPRAAQSEDEIDDSDNLSNFNVHDDNEQPSVVETDETPPARQASRVEGFHTEAKDRVEKMESTRGELPKLDPKILDDSSDDDSEGADSDTPIGPLLPSDTSSMPPEYNKLNNLPILQQVTLGSSHDSCVSSISIERAGNRMATASLDSTLKLWDFSTMDRSLQSFKTVNLSDDVPVRSVQFSATGRLLLCSGSTNAATILDRDGNVLSQTMKGDMYIVDMARTKGHTGDILSAKWKPSEGKQSKFMATTSSDGTVRLWDVTRTRKLPMAKTPVISQFRVTKLRDAKGARFTATTLDWIPDGSMYILGCNDGKLRTLDPNSYSLRPVQESRQLFSHGAEITSITCSSDESPTPLVLARSTDDSLRVFDRRKLENPLKVFENLPNAVSETNAGFLGDTNELFFTGTSSNRKDKLSRGNLALFSAKLMQEVWRSKADEDAGSVISTIWHSSLNQIVYGCADGKIRVMYHPTNSRKGILECIPKSIVKRKDGVASVGVGEIILPAAGGRNVSAKRSTVMPVRPQITGSSAIADNRASARVENMPLYPQVSKSIGQTSLRRAPSKEVSKEWFGNPREAILRYAEVAAKNPIFTNAYQATQPETILAEKTAEQEEEETRRAIYERDRIRRAFQQQKKNS